MDENIKISKKNKPTISVIMSVYNGERFLRESIDSILRQTYKNFEFIIINDGSKDSSLKLIKSYKDPRIVLISRANKGLVASLNEGIVKAKGKYIARQDDDDISLPNRFEEQIKLINSDNYAIVGGSIEVIREDDVKVGVHYAITNKIAIKEETMLRGPFAHGTAFGLAKIFKYYKYKKDMWPAEDYDLWERVSEEHNLGNTEGIIYKYRLNGQGISSKNSKAQKDITNKIRENAAKNIKIKPVKLKILLAGIDAKDAKRRVINNRIELIRQGAISNKYYSEAFAYKVMYTI